MQLLIYLTNYLRLRLNLSKKLLKVDEHSIKDFLNGRLFLAVYLSQFEKKNPFASATVG